MEQIQVTDTQVSTQSAPLLSPTILAAASSQPQTPITPSFASGRRSSTRAVKRKKFDDELVESSLAPSLPKFEKVKPKTTPDQKPSAAPHVTTTAPAQLAPTAPTELLNQQQPYVSTTTTTPPPSAPALSIAPVVQPTPAPAQAAPPTSQTGATLPVPPPVEIPSAVPTVTLPPPPVEKKKPTKSTNKRSKKAAKIKTQKPPPAASTKDLGRWKPQDDLALIEAVQQTCDLTAVFLGVKFSCKFTLREIQERWYALLYDPILSKLSIQAIKQLHPDIVSSVQSKALFSKREEEVLGRTVSTSQPTIDIFAEALRKNPDDFHPTRTPKSLYNHWLLMKQYHILPDQTVQPMPKGDHVLNFDDAEDIINDEDLRGEVRDEVLEHELSVADRRNKKEVRSLEQELAKWQVLVDSVTGINPQDFDNQTLAVLRGRLVRYLMRSREITLGRSTKDNQIDVDLSLEGPAWKISRRQGIIKLKNNGEFYIANEGARPLYIDGKPVLKGNKAKLNHNTVVEISCLRFIFLINQDLINVIRQEAQKMGNI